MQVLPLLAYVYDFNLASESDELAFRTKNENKELYALKDKKEAQNFWKIHRSLCLVYSPINNKPKVKVKVKGFGDGGIRSCVCVQTTRNKTRKKMWRRAKVETRNETRAKGLFGVVPHECLQKL